MSNPNCNPNCDSAHCVSPTGEVRVLPYGSSGNLILCEACFQHEMEYRKIWNRGLSKKAQWDIPKWENLEIYE